MRPLKKITLVSLFMVCFVNTRSQDLNKKFEDKIKKIYKYGKLAFDFSRDFVQTYHECVAYGNSPAYCGKAAGICATWNFTTSHLPGLPADIYRLLGLFEVFKPYCGNGTCFQCCFNGNGCHTSFIGFPVLNCNKTNYGPETRAAGLTVIVDPNPQPGQACLYTAQTCDHLGLCLSNLTPSQISSINNDPNHIIKSTIAKQERARTFANNSLEFGFNDLINNFSQGKPIKDNNGKIITIEANDDDLLDLLTGRGSNSWFSVLDSLNRNKGDIDGFRIKDTLTNTLIPSATKWNITRQFFLSRYLSSVPNLYNRMSFTESKIWTETDKLSYLGDTTKIDSIFLNAIHPFSLSVLSSNPSLQDYRLLSVPLPGESINTNIYNGDTIGSAPIIKVDATNNDFKINIVSSGTHLNSKPISLLIVWGDGTSSDTAISLNEVKSFTHNYKFSGDYRVLLFAQNTSGLRSVYLKNINVVSSILPNPNPSFNKFSFSNVGVGTTDLWTSFTNIFVDVYGVDTKGSYKIGNTKTIESIFRQSIISDSNLNVYNSNLKPFKNITFIPRHTTLNGYAFISFSDVKVNILNTNTMGDSIINLPINIDSIKLYDKNNRLIDRIGLVTKNSSGLIKIFFLFDTLQIAKIEVPISDSFSKANYLTSSTILNREIEGQFIEKRLDKFVKYNGGSVPADSITTIPPIKVYPNPTRGLLTINRISISNNKAKFNIYSINGQLIKSISLAESQTYFELNMAFFSSGVYIWEYLESGINQHGKIVKFN